MRGEGCPSKAHNAGKANLLNNGLAVLWNLCYKGVRSVDTIGPLIALHGNFYAHLGIACKVRARSYAFHRSAHGGVDKGRYKAAGLRNGLTHLHLVPHRHNGLGRSADMLGNLNVHGRRQRELLNGAVPGNLAVVRMYSAY